jgi:branched-chain amino acid transport system ATP-binding protein
MSEPLLLVNDVNLSFGGVSALSDVSFAVNSGETFAIIGPNGAGKSSLLNVLTGIYRPSSGSARVAGEELIGRRPHHIARLGVSRTFQNLGLFESMSVIDNVMVGRSAKLESGILAGSAWWGPSRREETKARRRCAEILDVLGLADLQAAHLGILPYGTKKRVELAKALASDPSILLLDEPVAGMNPEESAQIAHSIEVARAEMGATVVLIEHDLPLVMSIAHTVLVMDFGKVIAVGGPEAIQSDPEVLCAYTGDLRTEATPAHGHIKGA